VEQRPSGGVAHAVSDGIARVASAPAILAGTLALTFLFSLSLSQPLIEPFVLFEQYLAILWLSPLSISLGPSQTILWLVVWSFLAGGILDRYARNRPTRGRGFFGACGAHFPALLRLAVIEWLVLFAAARAGLDRYTGLAPTVVALAFGLLFLYARVRLVVEDRRSAIGAVLAGGRFIRRNPAAVPIFLVFAAAVWGGNWVWATLGPVLEEPPLLPFGVRLGPVSDGPSLLPYAACELIVATILFLVFASWASAIALFQARLAHASYTAGPPLEWPESPAAEAITNLSSSSNP
jgi:hypothetical protein